MSDALDHKTFDLVSAIAGRSYPTVEVEFYLDEALGFQIYELGEKRREALLLDAEDAKDIDEEFQRLAKSTESEKFTAALKGIPERVRRDVEATVKAEFPPKKNFVGQDEYSPEADAAFTVKMWSVYVQTVTDPDGAVTLMDETIAQSIYDDAPAAVTKVLNQGINKLQTGAEAGFESAAKELNFLSVASPEG